MPDHKITAKQRYHLKHFIKELQDHRGRGTELVTVYVPTGYDMSKIIQHLAQEQGTATNIKSTSTRKNVIDALERMIQHLRLIDKTPENGLAAFSGNVAEREGQSDVQVWSIEPPIPLNQRLYRCDKEFILDHLREIADDENVYGMIVLDKREGNVAILRGKTIIPLASATSAVPGKHKSGGQCLDPDTSVLLPDGSSIFLKDLWPGDKVLSLDSLGNFVAGKVVDRWKTTKEGVVLLSNQEMAIDIIASLDHIFFTKGMKEVPAGELSEGDTLLVADGVSGIKDSQLKQIKIDAIKHLDKEYDLIDISVDMKNFFAQGILVHNSAQRFERLRDGAAKEFYRRVADYAQKEFLHNKDLKGILIGGPGSSKEEFIEQGQLTQELKDKIIGVQDLSYTGDFGLQELLEKSEDILSEEDVMEEKVAMRQFFAELSKSTGKASYGKDEVMRMLQMGAIDTLLLSESLDDKVVEHYEEEAEKVGTETIIVSVETREGTQLKEMGGFAAILRYATNN